MTRPQRVTLHAIGRRPGRGKQHRVRWNVNGQGHEAGFAIKAQAQDYWAQLRAAISRGEAFDDETGEPISWNRGGGKTVAEFAHEWLTGEAATLKRRSVLSIAEVQDEVLVLLVRQRASEPPADVRSAIRAWLVDGGEAPAWLLRHSIAISEITTAQCVELEQRLRLRRDGAAAAPDTAARRINTAHQMVREMVRAKLLDADPWPPARRGRRRVSQTSTPRDWRTVPSHDDARALMANPVIHADEVEPAVAAILAGKGIDNHATVYGLLEPARTRFEQLDADDQAAFRDLLTRFVSLYAFVAQIVSFTDAGLERDYVYARALDARLPGRDAERIDIGSEVALTHLRTEQASAGSASLEEGDGTVRAIFAGTGKEHEPDAEPLSTIVEALNARFGTNLDDRDQLLFDQFEESWLADPEVAAQARNNEFDNFRLVFDRMFLGTVVGRMDDNEAIFKRVLDDPEFQQTLMDLYAMRVYRRLRAGDA